MDDAAFGSYLRLEVREFLHKINPDLLPDVLSEDAEEAVQHMLVLVEAWRVYMDRDKRYKKGWRDRGWKGNVCDVLRKAVRIRSMFWEDNYDVPDNAEEIDVDDLVDQINYSVFSVRNLRDGRRWG